MPFTWKTFQILKKLHTKILKDRFAQYLDMNMIKTLIICDPACENPAKVIFLVIYYFLQKIILHKVKNILWKCNLDIFNIDWVRPCQRLKS